MTIKQMQFGNLVIQRFSTIKSCAKRIRVSFAQDSLKCQNLELKRLVFEQAKDPVIQ